jgi:Bacterial Ig-like domain (group 3)
MFAFSLLPGFWRNRRVRVMFATSAIVLLAVACGGGSSSGSGGSGNLNQTVPAVPTTTALTFLSPKVAANQNLLATATITSTNPVSGAVQFFELASPDLPLSAFIDVQNSKATTSIALPGIGIYGIYAQYTGDSLNQKSKSPTVPATVTGTTQLGVSGITATLVHNTPVTLTVQ